MGRKSRFKRFKIEGDSVYNDVDIARFINKIMVSGKKHLAENICYAALDRVVRDIHEDPVSLFQRVLGNLAPKVEVRTRRIGGAMYRIPVDVKPRRQSFLSMKWLVDAARSRSEKTMVERLSLEMIDVYNKVGRAFKKREEMYKMVEANKMFAHFRH